MNMVEINIDKQISSNRMQACLERCLVSGVARSCGSPIFSLLRNLHADFPNGCSSLHSHQHWMSVLFPHTLSCLCYLFPWWWHYDTWEMESQTNLDLHFYDGQRCWHLKNTYWPFVFSIWIILCLASELDCCDLCSLYVLQAKVFSHSAGHFSPNSQLPVCRSF